MKRLKDFVERKFRYDVDIALFIACCTLVCLFIYGILTTIFPNSDIGGKVHLKESMKLCNICMMIIFF